jgi:hypothetical protein
MPSLYLLAAWHASLAWSAGCWASPDAPALLYTVWTGVGPATYWADMAIYWGLRGC